MNLSYRIRRVEFVSDASRLMLLPYPLGRVSVRASGLSSCKPNAYAPGFWPGVWTVFWGLVAL